MFNILITDASYKHSIAIQRYIRESMSDIYLTGHQKVISPFARYYRYLDRLVENIALESLLKTERFDMVIPVGGKSVLSVAKICPWCALLPSKESINTCFNKFLTMNLADKLNIPHPSSIVLRSPEEFKTAEIKYPCVLKPLFETTNFGVFYINDRNEFVKRGVEILQIAKKPENEGILVQDYIKGVGCGFFALYKKGKPLRIFMHKRIREYPITGGPSTAARSFYSDKLKEYGLTLLDALNWNGVAMVEFKHTEESDSFSLMEINAKFWGSTELSLRSGVNFGADLIRAYKGEKMEYSERYDRNISFYWPLDGDLLNLWRTRRFAKIRDYFNKNATNNLGVSFRADFWKVLSLLKNIVLGK